MTIDPATTAAGAPPGSPPAASAPGKPSPRVFGGLVLGAIGVVFGDIGTSPMYALRESLAHAASGGLQKSEVVGIVSLILWSLIIIVTLKYVVFLMRADNKGEGGTLSLLALTIASVGKRTPLLFMLGIMAAALFYGDAMITPAITVLSAIEGLKQVTPVFTPYIVPITMVILIGLFAAQSYGTGAVAKLFGPITLVWFIVLGILGLMHIGDDLSILEALSPTFGIQFLALHGQVGFLVLGAVFLAVTGAEALYADMGHFGRGPIRLGWLALVFPCLAINYLGQGAMVLKYPEMAVDPFFLSVPKAFLIPVVLLATAASVIASQAVITGAYSITQQAIQLGLLPRLEIRHTSATQRGQIFLPRVNTLLLLAVLVLVVAFRTSSNLASAYGIAVTGTMIVDTVLAFVFVRRAWKWSRVLAFGVILPLLIAETAFFLANMLKVASGGYVPLLVSGVLMLCMWTWVRGTNIIFSKSRRESVPLTDITNILSRRPPARVSGTAVFLTADPDTAPPALMHNLKHNKVLHQRNVILCVESHTTPRVVPDQRIKVEVLSDDFIRVRVDYGYMETPDIPEALNLCRAHGLTFEIMSTSFFLARRNLRVSSGSDMPMWQDKLYIALSKEAASATDFFRIPAGRVVELGQQIVV